MEAGALSQEYQTPTPHVGKCPSSLMVSLGEANGLRQLFPGQISLEELKTLLRIMGEDRVPRLVREHTGKHTRRCEMNLDHSMGGPEKHQRYKPCTATNFICPLLGFLKVLFLQGVEEWDIVSMVTEKVRFSTFCPFSSYLFKLFFNLISLGPTFQKYSESASQCLSSHS